jgi:fimbrial chaperone protein
MRRFAIAVACCLLVPALSAHAIQVRPLIAEYSPRTTKGTLHVSNPGKTEKTYQVLVDRWHVVNGEKARTRSSALRIAPAVFTMEPGKSQTLRWALIATEADPSSAGSGEQAYRIRLEEVPDPARVQQAGLTTTLNMDFPWFWRARDLAPSLSARWDGSVLIVSNTGTATAQLVDLVSGAVSKPGLVGYVLPGETARFDLGGKGSGSVSLKVNGKDSTLAAN